MAPLLRRRNPNAAAAAGLDTRRHSNYFGGGATAAATAAASASASALGGDLPHGAQKVGIHEQMARPKTADIARPAPAPAAMELHMPSVPGVGASGRPATPPVQEESTRHRRFSLLKFRHASEPQLSTRARLQAQEGSAPPMPMPPAIIRTSPTLDINGAQSKKKSKAKLLGKPDSASTWPAKLAEVDKQARRSSMSEGSTGRTRVTFDEPQRLSGHAGPPPAYGEEGTLALPVNRLSESSRSDASSAEHGIYATTTTTHTVHTTTTFFRLPRRKKSGPLFPLPPRVIAPDHGNSLAVPTGFGSGASSRSPSTDSAAVSAVRMGSLDASGFTSPLPSPSHSTAGRSSNMFAPPGSPLGRHSSNASGRSSPIRRLGMRSRASTMSSLRNTPSEDALPTPPLPSARTSTSTGRKSFGDLFGLSHRMRHNSELHLSQSGPATPGSITSKNNSMQLTREPVVIPERQQDDTPKEYLDRLKEAVSRGAVASILSKGTDTFTQQVLRSYMREFSFFGDPMDMAIRKLLMEAELPKETQQIDRCLQSFADRYHECNPGIYATPDQAYFIAFSLLILHTDVFNKNNKHKMQKHDYIKNTQGEGIFDEILECFYDNISYTPFIHVEDDLDINGERIVQLKTKKKSSIFPRGPGDPTKKPLKEPVDPYTLILDRKLDILRPNLKEAMNLEEHYNYLGTASALNLQDLHKTFFRTGVLQIVSARSRPDAFMTEKTLSNPDEAQAGIVDIKITKVGLLWRKDPKKKKTRSPWQEWGAILTGAQLYFFRNTTWIKNLMHQHEQHIKQGQDGIPVIFKPPLEQFKPDALMSTDDAVALLDSTYKKHKNAFVFVRHGGFEETFLADNEEEMNDWLAKLNYAAAFRTSGVRMRGLVGGHLDGQRARGMRRLESSHGAARSIQTPTGEVTIMSGKIDQKMAQDILAARREIMLQKISEAEEKLSVAEKQLDAQLRNARHLQILAPIQAKSRDQLLVGAGRMSAKLRWVRMEIWRLKCHKDILSMDLEEERVNLNVDSGIPTPQTAERVGLFRNGLTESPKLSSQPSHSPRLRPATQPVASSSREREFGMEDIFVSPPALQSAASFYKSQASWELPPLTFDPRRRPSTSSNMPITPILTHTSSFPSIRPMPSVEPQRSVSTPQPLEPQPDAAERAVLQQEGLMETPVAHEKGFPDTEDSKDRSEHGDKDKLDRGKIRRSLHRTLREAHVPSHHRTRKGRESTSSAGISDEAPVHTHDDVLARGTGSFTVHGKKASVITFGEEFSHMSPDERLRLRKSAHRPDAPTSGGSYFSSSIPNEDGFDSLMAEPIEYYDPDAISSAQHNHRHASTASESTATARSFRELHKRLSHHAAQVSTGAIAAGARSEDGDSEAAVSFSEGRRTPLPPVEDEDEGVDDKDEREDEDERSPQREGKQAAFFTPEMGRSPTSDGRPALEERESVAV